ncbi:MAG: SemiSWEET transporter [Candidatus Marinimicrobia bacterium]|jgi:MtN3 and saliva related transmembrane protein|nr:SemiSWEET transporter [Candidatus Neomarinimicrobiota bacterium]
MNWITIIGFLAATGTTISLLPQAIKIIKTKHAKDISLGMYLILTTGIFLWLVYGILIKDLPLIVANGISLFFSVSVLILKLIYK